MKKIILLSLISLFVISCSSDKNSGGGGGGNVVETNDFNRKAMLTHWANDIIIPSFEAYDSSVEELNNKVNAFNNDVNTANLVALRKALTDTYMQWQTVAFYEVGPAVTNNLRAFTNTYPTNVTKIKENIDNDDYRLTSYSQTTQQGLPAMDYLINGIAQGDNAIVDVYKGEAGAKNRKYLVALANRLKDLSSHVITTWKSSYKDTFINNNGSSSTASVDLIANAYMLYYEAYMRNGKVRFPSGATLGDNAFPNKVESLYNPELSLPLLVKSLESMQNFFNGRLSSSQSEGLGFKQYLDKYNEVKKGDDIAAKINKAFDNSIAKAKEMKNQGTLYNLLQTNREEVIQLHDIINSNVINLKTDMFQALNIQVTYVDGDGD
ncbi:imelysin family protein [Weeksellaceae bacterium TAE3-ERU29]|nr:imelysin family protein [Weeksellaceae bacterium TAE3-ERU29]